MTLARRSLTKCPGFAEIWGAFMDQPMVKSEGKDASWMMTMLNIEILMNSDGPLLHVLFELTRCKQ